MTDWLQLADTAGDDPEPGPPRRYLPIALAVLLVVLAAVLVAWSR